MVSFVLMRALEHRGNARGVFVKLFLRCREGQNEWECYLTYSDDLSEAKGLLEKEELSKRVWIVGVDFGMVLL